MRRRDAILLVTSLGAIVIAGITLATRPHAAGEDLTRVTWWACEAPDCDQGAFSLDLASLDSMIENGRVHPETGLPACPKCGAFSVRKAYPCPNCREPLRLIAHGQIPSSCPSCGALLRERAPGARDEATCAAPIPSGG